MAEVVVGDLGNSDLLAGALQSFVAPRNLYDAILAPCFVSPKAFQQGLHVWKDRDPSNLTVLRAGFRMAANHDLHPLPVNVIPGHCHSRSPRSPPSGFAYLRRRETPPNRRFAVPSLRCSS